MYKIFWQASQHLSSLWPRPRQGYQPAETWIRCWHVTVEQKPAGRTNRNDKDECPFKLSPSDPCVSSSDRLLNVQRVQTDGDSVRPAPSHGVCFGPGGSHGGRFHQSLIPEQLLEVDDMLLTVLSWWHTCTNINTSSNEALMLKKESEVKACVCFFIFSRDIMIKPTGSQWEGNVFSSELTSPFLWEGADYSEDDMNRRQETTPCFRGWTLSLDLSCRLLNVQLCVFSLTGVEAGTSSQPLVSLLERPEHGVEQHLVSGLLRRVQELPGRHVVVATCSPWHQWGLVHFKVWILWVCQKSYCWLWSFMETRSSSS